MYRKVPPENGAAVAGPNPSEPVAHRMPRWVKGFLIAGLVVLALAVAAFVVGGSHGPSRHLPGGDEPVESSDGHTSPVDQR